MNDITGVDELDPLGQLIGPLDDLRKVKGFVALLANTCGEVAIAAELHQDAHATINYYFLIDEVCFEKMGSERRGQL